MIRRWRWLFVVLAVAVVVAAGMPGTASGFPRADGAATSATAVEIAAAYVIETGTPTTLEAAAHTEQSICGAVGISMYQPLPDAWFEADGLDIDSFGLYDECETYTFKATLTEPSANSGALLDVFALHRLGRALSARRS